MKCRSIVPYTHTHTHVYTQSCQSTCWQWVSPHVSFINKPDTSTNIPCITFVSAKHCILGTPNVFQPAHLGHYESHSNPKTCPSFMLSTLCHCNEIIYLYSRHLPIDLILQLISVYINTFCPHNFDASFVLSFKILRYLLFRSTC